MKKVDFALFYEHRQRELFGIQSLSAELQRRGYTVEVRKSDCAYPQKRRLDPIDFEADVVVWPQTYMDDHIRHAGIVPGWDGKLVNLQAEQIYSDYVTTHAFNRIRESAVNAFHVSWGEQSSAKFRAWGIPEENIWQVGSIHLDLCDPRFDPAFPTREEMARKHGLDASKRWVVFFSSFSHAEMSPDDLAFWTAKLPGFAAFREIERASKSGICTWLSTYCANHPDVEIIYRPHPSEYAFNDPALPRMAASMPNFHYLSDGPALEWTKVSDRVLTWFSTSMADAHFADKPFAILRPVELGDHYELELFRGAELTTSFEAFESFMQAEAPTSPVTPETFAAYYANAAGEPAYELLADALIRLRETDLPHPFPGIEMIGDNGENESLLPADSRWLASLPERIVLEHEQEAAVFERVSRARAVQDA